MVWQVLASAAKKYLVQKAVSKGIEKFSSSPDSAAPRVAAANNTLNRIYDQQTALQSSAQQSRYNARQAAMQRSHVGS